MRILPVILLMLGSIGPLCATEVGYSVFVNGSRAEQPITTLANPLPAGGFAGQTSLGTTGTYYGQAGVRLGTASSVFGAASTPECDAAPCGVAEYGTYSSLHEVVSFSNLTGSVYLFSLDYLIQGAVRPDMGDGMSAAGIMWSLFDPTDDRKAKTGVSIGYSVAHAPVSGTYTPGDALNTQVATPLSTEGGYVRGNVTGTYWGLLFASDGVGAIQFDQVVTASGGAASAGTASAVGSRLYAMAGQAHLFQVTGSDPTTGAPTYVEVPFEYGAAGSGVRAASLTGIDYRQTLVGDPDGDSGVATPDQATALLVGGGLAFGAWKRRKK